MTAKRTLLVLVWFVAGMVAVLPGAAASAQPAPDAEVPSNEGRVGDVVIVAGDADGSPIARGGSATHFSLGLPDGASCPGDSATGNWRIQSFLVPAADDPGTFSYESTKPAGDGRWALYGLDTRSYINRLTAVAADEGGEGVIDEEPTFDFSLFPPGTLPNGTYRVGIACTWWGDTYRYWDTEIVITNDVADQPAQLTWAVVSSPDSPDASSSSSSSAPVLVAVIVVAGLVAAAVAFVLRGRRRPAVHR